MNLFKRLGKIRRRNSRRMIGFGVRGWVNTRSRRGRLGVKQLH